MGCQGRGAAVTAKAIAVLGTGSDVGKSLITAGICRMLRRQGVRVAPFKAQNMSLNSFVTPEGGEIGRAQALQAEACGLPPHVDMNPILLKPETDSRSQVVLLGKAITKLEASAYFDRRQELWKVVQESYARLAVRYDVIVIEGAGSAAEVNLAHRDLVNWPMVRFTDAKVVLTADIDRGGVFAQIIGTLELLDPEDRGRVCGIVINKFRGDRRLFDDGIHFLESRTRIPVLGLVPFVRDLRLDQEDSLNSEQSRYIEFAADLVNIAVIRTPHMSNFTDFNALVAEADVALRYISSPSEMKAADVVVLPGSKNTLDDLAYLRQEGFPAACGRHVSSKKELVGICGGYQMLGRSIRDPYNVEQGGSSAGLGFLDVVTELQQEKRIARVEAGDAGFPMRGPGIVRGYRIHMGATRRLGGLPCFKIRSGEGSMCDGELEGTVTSDGLVWGTYIHGVFDESGFRRSWLNRIRERKGLPQLGQEVSETVTACLSKELDRWADHLAAHVNMELLLRNV